MANTRTERLTRRLALRQTLALAGAAVFILPLRTLARSHQTQIAVWKDPYDVLLIATDGSTRVYQSYNRT